MTDTDITYHGVMGRWEPDAAGRLAQAALTLYAEQGFEQTTAAQIAQAVGLTERTFFRHFSDKREVLFHGQDSLRDILVDAIAGTPPSATAMDAVGAALQATAALLQQDPEGARLRTAVVLANAELRERELVKFAELAAVMAGALRDRGVPEQAASLATETAIVVFKVARARWLSDPGQPDLPGILRESLADLKGLLTGQFASSPS
jgi:AcrR family transcriptional regulator